MCPTVDLMAIEIRHLDPVAAVRRALKEGRDRAEAVSILASRMKAEPDLRLAMYDKFQPSTIEQVAHAAVRMVAPAERQVVRVLAQTDDVAADRHLVSRVGRIKDALARWTLPSGVKLQRATREELIVAAEFVEAQARALVAVGRQYRAIAKRLEPGEVVGDVLDDEALVKFFDQG